MRNTQKLIKTKSSTNDILNFQLEFLFFFLLFWSNNLTHVYFNTINLKCENKSTICLQLFKYQIHPSINIFIFSLPKAYPSPLMDGGLFSESFKVISSFWNNYF